MCGIVGLVDEAPANDRAARLRGMARSLAHRGPDDEGFFDDGPVALGFRRLAVIDLETGQQPIVMEDGSAAIVLNGEIYNFRELRRELEGRGHRFRSRGDVEVVLRLYAEMGIAALGRLDGMFALAVWDARTRQLHLARDRFGIKPLYLWTGDGRVAFASEMRALAAGGIPPRRDLDPAELRHYLALGHFTPAGSPWRGTCSVAPGTVVTVGLDGGTTTRKWWTPPAPGAREHRGGGVVRTLRGALEAAVERQLVADVPVGVFLSGGLDSSVVSALAAPRVTGRLRTFSVGFTGPGAVSELPAAARVARHLGSEHHELVVDASEVAADLDRLLGDLDAPLADATAIPTWYMSRLARERVVVALSGEGADELFGGYARQRYDVAVDRAGAAGRRLAPGLLRLIGRPPSGRLERRLAMTPGVARQLDWGRVLDAGVIDRIAPGLASEGEMLAPYAALGERWRRFATLDPVNGRLETDREVFLPGDLLPKVDRMSMAHSLEVRVPYLGDEVVDLVLPLPGRFKQSLTRDKIVLRRVAHGLLPPETAARRKQGFDVPIGDWLRGPLRQAAGDLLAAGVVARCGVCRPEGVLALRDAHLEGRADLGREVWTLVVLHHWLLAAR